MRVTALQSEYKPDRVLEFHIEEIETPELRQAVINRLESNGISPTLFSADFGTGYYTIWFRKKLRHVSSLLIQTTAIKCGSISSGTLWWRFFRFKEPIKPVKKWELNR